MLVSVVIPAYNAEKHIEETLRSICAQTYHPVEIMVVDDGSGDRTGEIVQTKFPEVRYFRQNNAGVAAARNLGIRKATGEYIAVVDADDLWLPGKLAAQMDRIAKTGAVWCYCDCLFFQGDASNVLYRLSALSHPSAGMILEPLLLNNFIASPTTLIRRRELLETGLFNEAISPMAADWDMWIRVGARHPVEYIDQALAAYRLHPESMMGSSSVAGILDPNMEALSSGLALLPDGGRRIAAKARANIFFKVGLVRLKRGDMTGGRKMFFQALRQDPSQLRFYGYQLCSLLPAAAVKRANLFRHWIFRVGKPIEAKS